MERIEIQFRVELKRARLNGGKVALLVGDFVVESPSPDFPLYRSRFYLVGIVKRLTLRDSAKPRGWAMGPASRLVNSGTLCEVRARSLGSLQGTNILRPSYAAARHYRELRECRARKRETKDKRRPRETRLTR